MQIAFVNPPFLPRFSRESRSPAVTKSDTLYYPHWLCYAAAATSTVPGVEVSVVDACAAPMSVDALVARLHSLDPRLVVLDTSTPSVHSDIRTAGRLRQALPRCRVALAGPHVSATARRTLEEAASRGVQVDFVLRGEYDATCQAMAVALRDGQPLDSLPGQAHLDAQGRFIDCGRRAAIEDLDGIPFVSEIYARHLPIERYFMGHTKYPMVTLISGRGCPYRCSYCQLPQVMYGHRFRARSVENFLDELQRIQIRLPQVRGVMLEDDTFTVDRQRVRTICQGMLDRRIRGFELTCNARADVDRATLELMRAAGFTAMCVGFESAAPKVLHGVEKGIGRKRMDTFVRDADAVGMRIHGCFMFGNRHESRATMRRTLDWALSLPLDTAQFYPLMLSPGTKDFERFEEQGLLRSRDFATWLDPEGMHRATVNHPNLSAEELEGFCDHARRRFYLRPHYLARKLAESARSADALRKNMRGARVLMGHLRGRPGRGVA